jgi:hypothetical protein
MKMDILNLTVDETLDTDMPDESMSIVLTNGAPMIVFNFSVTEKDIAAFQYGSTSFGLFAENNVLFFLFQIKGFLEWSDLAFTIHLAQDKQVRDDGGYLPFHLVLVESRLSIIKAMRIITVSPSFRSALNKYIWQQANERFDIIVYYKRIGGIYNSYPSAALMLKKAIIVEHGGMTLPS